MSFLLALFMTLTSVGTATSADDFETSDQAMEALEALMIPPREATRLTAEQLRERTVLLRSWLDRAEALDLDFGPRNYVGKSPGGRCRWLGPRLRNFTSAACFPKAAATSWVLPARWRRCSTPNYWTPHLHLHY